MDGNGGAPFRRCIQKEKTHVRKLQRRWHIPFALLVLLVAMGANAERLPLADPADVGMDPDRLARHAEHR